MAKTLRVSVEDGKLEKVKYDTDKNILVKIKGSESNIEDHFIVEMDAYDFHKLNSKDEVKVIILFKNSQGIYEPYPSPTERKRKKEELEHASTYNV